RDLDRLRARKTDHLGREPKPFAARGTEPDFQHLVALGARMLNDEPRARRLNVDNVMERRRAGRRPEDRRTTAEDDPTTELVQPLFVRPFWARRIPEMKHVLERAEDKADCAPL